MFCPKCGSNIPERSVFCTNCGHRIQEAAPQPPTQPAASPLATLTTDPVKLFSYLSCAASVLAMILWLCIKFVTSISFLGITKTQSISLYETFFEPTHTTFLTVFVVLGFIAAAVFVLIPTFNLGFIKKSTSYKIAFQSSAVANILGILSLNACLATSNHEALEYMNFAGWACFIFGLAGLALCVLAIHKAKKTAKKQ